MKMSCEKFAEQLNNNYFWDEMIDEAFWSNSFNSEYFFDYLQSEATEKGISLSDLEEFDYDEYFYELYKSSEKGLS